MPVVNKETVKLHCKISSDVLANHLYDTHIHSVEQAIQYYCQRTICNNQDEIDAIQDETTRSNAIIWDDYPTLKTAALLLFAYIFANPQIDNIGNAVLAINSFEFFIKPAKLSL